MLGPKRAKETTRPDVICPETLFMKCGVCGRIIQIFGGDPDDRFMTCCAEFMQPLEPISPESLPGFNPDYTITGGYDDNCIKVEWNTLPEKIYVKWVYLKTYTGFQMKYIPSEKINNTIFALAGTDAYVYCDEDPCLECTFLCKRGFEILFILSNDILAKLPMNRMKASW